MDLWRSSPRPAVPSDPQRSLNDALASFRSVLTIDQKEALKNSRQETDVDKVMVFTAELDQKAKAMKGPSVATRLHAVLEAVHLFSTVVDVFVSSNPETAALVWGSVKMTMLIMINYTSYFAPLSKLFMAISAHCPRFTEYQALFPISVRLQQALCDFHAAIVRCCQHVVECMKRTWSQHILKAVLQSFDQEFKPDIDAIARLAENVKEEVKLATIKALQQEQLLQASERKASSLNRSLLRKHLPKVDEDLRAIQTRYLKQDRERLLSRISSFNYLHPFKDTCKKRHNRTADWILAENTFIQWRSGTGPHVLCCYGKIGSGKTVLCTNVINHLFLQKQNGAKVTFFLAQEDDAESLLAETMLRSILLQSILATQPSTEFMGRMADMLDKLYVSTREWTALLQELVASTDVFYIIADGLNACSIAERRLLLQELSFVLDASPNLRVFLCGRDSLLIDTKKAFAHFARLSTASVGLRADISLFIEEVLDESLQNGDLVMDDPSLRELVDTTLNERADDMFLLVVHLVREVCIASYSNDILRTLAELPRDLESVYQRILERILAEDTMVEAVEKSAHWVAAVRRPLTIEELQEAISVYVGQPYSEPDKQVPNFERIVLWSKNLLQCSEEEPRKIRFAHPTIRAYLAKDCLPPELRLFHTDVRSMDHFIGEICMTYLNFNDFRTEIATQAKQEYVAIPPLVLARTALGSTSVAAKLTECYSRLRNVKGGKLDDTFGLDISPAVVTPPKPYRDHPFLRYAEDYWLSHTKQFTRKNSHHWNLFRQIMTKGHKLVKWPAEGEPEQITAQLREYLEHHNHYAMFLAAIQDWLLLEKQCPTCHSACLKLDHRSLRCLDTIAQHLKGRDASDLSSFVEAAQIAGVVGYDLFGLVSSGTSLSRLEAFTSALKAPHLDQTYWRLGAHAGDVELLMASERGHAESVKWSLQRSESFRKSRSHDFEHDWRILALGEAAKNNHYVVVDILLENGTPVDAEDCQGLTALHHAAWRGHHETVVTLLDYRASINRFVTLTPFTPEVPNFSISLKHTTLTLAVAGQHWSLVEDLEQSRHPIISIASFDDLPELDLSRSTLSESEREANTDAYLRLCKKHDDVMLGRSEACLLFHSAVEQAGADNSGPISSPHRQPFQKSSLEEVSTLCDDLTSHTEH